MCNKYNVALPARPFREEVGPSRHLTSKPSDSKEEILPTVNLSHDQKKYHQKNNNNNGVSHEKNGKRIPQPRNNVVHSGRYNENTSAAPVRSNFENGKKKHVRSAPKIRDDKKQYENKSDSQ